MNAIDPGSCLMTEFDIKTVEHSVLFVANNQKFLRELL